MVYLKIFLRILLKPLIKQRHSNSHFETFVLKSEPLKACALNFMNGRMGIPAIDSCSK